MTITNYLAQSLIESNKLFKYTVDGILSPQFFDTFTKLSLLSVYKNGDCKSYHGPQWLKWVGSRVQLKGVTEEAAGLMSLKHVALTGLNSSLSDLFWITTSVKWSTSLGWSNRCPAPSYLNISPLVAKSSGPTWKDMPLALSHQWIHLRARGEDKGQGYSSVGNVL